MTKAKLTTARLLTGNRRRAELPVLVLSGEPRHDDPMTRVPRWLAGPFHEEELIEAVPGQLQRIRRFSPYAPPRRPTPTAALRKL
jgi:hypothetical protein